MPTKLPFHLRSALEQARQLRARKICARELLDLCWAQVEKHNKALNAVIVSDIERARRLARQALALDPSLSADYIGTLELFEDKAIIAELIERACEAGLPRAAVEVEVQEAS